jgi:diphosphomevalonate decarboxylase
VTPEIVVAEAHPSLALVKYWVKQTGGVNIPATSSLAVTLGDLTTTTRCAAAPRDRVVINGEEQPAERFAQFFAHLRQCLQERGPAFPTEFHVDSTNTFPTAAGLASSASGLAALTLAAVGLAGHSTEDRPWLSAIARYGSGSAARSIFGGFTAWPAGASAAAELRPSDWWPALRIVVAPISGGAKPVSSREAMNRTRDTAPTYSAWVTDSEILFARARRALEARDIEQLGTVMRLSYLRMFSTMLAADPPLVFWLPNSVAAIHAVADLRRSGVPAWETMDAGPQVKVLTEEGHVDTVVSHLAPLCAQPPIVSRVGGAARVVSPDPRKDGP